MGIEVGDQAPGFSLPASTGGSVSLEDFAGRQPVVIYFYPRDMTPGCTREACDWRDRSAELKKRGLAVLGISPDPLDSHAKFIAKESLNFPLLADTDHAVCEQYGVWVEKINYGKKYMGVERSTFLVDKQGRIARAWRKVKVEGHAEEVLAAAEKLK